MFDQADNQSSRLGRLLSDPVRLRARGRVAAIVAAGCMVVAELLSGFASGMLIALLWVVAPLLAMAIGVGDAFFIQHGRSRRRALITLAAAGVVALATCAVLAGITSEARSLSGKLVSITGNTLLYAAVVFGLAAGIALAIGRGTDYAARRIDEMSREDW